MKFFFSSINLLLLLLLNSFSNAQESVSIPINWQNLDHVQNNIWGASIEKAHQELLINKPNKEVVVAVIDNGIDTKHEDLIGKIWVNQKEIENNNIDDDKNGYVDDVNGWNFLGSKIGDIEFENLELTRQYKYLKTIFEGKTKQSISKTQLKEFQKFKEYEKRYNDDLLDVEVQFAEFSKMMVVYSKANDFLKVFFKKENYTEQDISEMQPKSEEEMIYKNFMDFAFQNNLKNQILEGQDYFEASLKYHYNLDYSPRILIGDDVNNMNENNYGNNNVAGPSPDHGTHVAGIIAANRNNNLGGKGVLDNVKIMCLRAVPNGDEQDKDIANAVIYAANNGAQIINMSFGKSISPNKKFVDDAIEYATNKGVLIIHGSGNESKNIDKKTVYPSRKLLDKKWVSNWLEVGANSAIEGENFPGNFSNYGKKYVDIFAPGVGITSTTPGNTYKMFDGTSMSAPLVAGVAALLKSYFPNLTAIQIIDIITKSSEKYTETKVLLPGSLNKIVKFKKLSNTGGVLNAYNAVRVALEM
jgi:cell wall-associated protease